MEQLETEEAANIISKVLKAHGQSLYEIKEKLKELENRIEHVEKHPLLKPKDALRF